MKKKDIVLSIVIITWNMEKFLEGCLDSIADAVGNYPYEIILVDNGSTDRTIEMICGHSLYKKINLIENEVNRGVAPARNQGLRVMKGKYSLILDADTVCKKGSLACLVEFMEKNTDCGIAGPKLLYGNGILQYSCRNFPTVFTKVYRRTGFGKRVLRKEMMMDWDHDHVKKVDYVIGACQIIRNKAINKIGLLDENIFYGPEDVDYCFRMWKNGWDVFYVPQSVVVHLEQRITKKFFSKITFKHITGLIYYFLKHKYFFRRMSFYEEY